MFKKLFGGNKEKTPVRTVEKVQDLQTGDAFRVGFDHHPEISNKEFFVQSVTGLDLSSKAGFERRIFHIGLTDDGRELLMWCDDEVGNSRLAFAYCATQPHVESMINIDQFVQLFEQERDYLVQVEANKASLNDPWLARDYTEDQAKEVYWLEGDPKTAAASQSISDGEKACDYFRLTDKTQEFAIEVFVFEGGQTDVYFVNYMPTYKIEEYMPSG